MANNTLIVILVIIAIALVLYFFVFDKKIDGACRFCPNCKSGGDPANCVCPDCPLNQNAMQVLNQIARGCAHRLRGVVRENLTSPADVSTFMNSGKNRLVVISDAGPDVFIAAVDSGKPDVVVQLRAVAMSSAVVNGKKTYLVMKMVDGKLAPIGSPTENFGEAFKYLNDTVRKDLGADTSNLVFYIDEDIACPEVVTPLPLPIESPKREECCGKRY